jgi:hypothetical protein
MRRKAKLLLVFLAVACAHLLAQHAVDPSQRYFRLICLVHLTGSGKRSDPIRPEYVPAKAAPDRNGILAWSVQFTDDRKMAIVQYVAAYRSAFSVILADKRPEIRVFEIGKTPPAAIEAEMRKYKKDFSLESLRVYAQ